ncbi:ThiF family adenylyltransferase [Arenibacter sp. M-2]|uniref:ThiF family adenylyltransferase n=1 Tax=Arenibacter sp. M-2 TaxID=3053612 RepID=UPI0025712147|nr:ThiF family adenylyltransferase [Arenibacter sp. M-2]MDL5514862.1 ThiF family adenylyltransferase [Arenibacter sp. M-2]
MKYQLRISGKHAKQMKKHLFPSDNMEAVSIALCGHHKGDELIILCVHEVFDIPYDQCRRSPDYVNWKTESLIPLIEKAAKLKLSVVKFHSHPGGFNRFSELDDTSDWKLFPSIYGWIDGEHPHGSVVALPNGKFFGRVIGEDNNFQDFERIMVAGDTINIFCRTKSDVNPGMAIRNIQSFGLGTSELLKNMVVGVVGASGTGSPLIEQLVRLGMGKIIMIDPDIVELKNLNRILNTYKCHAETESFKVDVIKEAIKKIGFETEVVSYTDNLYDSRDSIIALISCDVIFGCVDSIDGRHLLNQISTFYCIPYFDIGIKLEADGLGGINQINGAVHFIQPGGSSLLSRGVYSIKGLEAATLKRENNDEYEMRLKEKYIVNVNVESPAVISVNMFVSSFCVNDFLNRIHQYKGYAPSERAVTWLSLSEDMIFHDCDGVPDDYLAKKVGLGDQKPFLDVPGL